MSQRIYNAVMNAIASASTRTNREFEGADYSVLLTRQNAYTISAKGVTFAEGHGERGTIYCATKKGFLQLTAALGGPSAPQMPPLRPSPTIQSGENHFQTTWEGITIPSALAEGLLRQVGEFFPEVRTWTWVHVFIPSPILLDWDADRRPIFALAEEPETAPPAEEEDKYAQYDIGDDD